MPNYAIINGKFIPVARATISIFDRGFLYGDGLFETLRVYNRKIFRLPQHLWRLRTGLNALKIRGAPDSDRIAAATRKLVARNQIRDGVVRILVTRGNGGVGLNIGDCLKPLLVIYAQEKAPRAEIEYLHGWRVITSRLRVSAASWLEATKTISRVAHVMAKAEAEALGVNDALLLNTRGHLTEGTTSNLFIIKRGGLFTPPIADGLLGGITRAAIFELARALKIPAAEKHLRPTDLYRADEAFLTSTLLEIMPITAADGKKIGNGQAGPLTQNLCHEFRELVRRELGWDILPTVRL